jgi:F-type H+-transporting ATPase subunit gamma
MASSKDIRRRIKTVKNIEKITSAMKMVAAARLRKAQEKAQAARPYAEKMKQVMSNLSSKAGEIKHPLLEVRPEEKAAYVIIGAERGLAGSFNNNVMNAALRHINSRDIETVKMVLVGKKAISFFNKRDFEILQTLETSGSGVAFSDVSKITNNVRQLFESADVDAVYVVYAKFVSAMSQVPVVLQMLPMAPPESEAALQGEYIFEPSPAVLLADLLPRYLETQVYQAMVESGASEYGARMTAMSAATKNAGEMIDNLTLVYNKARQAAITKEILEIVSGAEALK